MHEIIMPKLGLAMTSGTVQKWYKREGEKVSAGEVLLAVESDKTTIEVETYFSGTLLKIVRQEGEEVPVTEVIGYIGEPSETIPDSALGPAREVDAPAGRSAGMSSPEKAAGGEEPVLKISPVARKLAEEKGLDVRLITGSGPGGRIVLEDVERAAVSRAGGAGSPGPSSTAAQDRAGLRRAAREKSRTPLTSMRKVISERLTYSAQTIPHIMVSAVIDASGLLDARQRMQGKACSSSAPRATLTDFIVKAAALVLEEQPAVNSAFIDRQHVVYEDINIGIAAATENGLLVPTIYAANTLTVLEIAEARATLLARIAAGKHSVDDISNGTFTISNLGMFGIRSFTAIINPPQAAILMIGETYKSAVVAADGTIVTGTLMNISLAVDHRILDGADAARFLSRLREVLQNPLPLAPGDRP